jgi:hypothetical protein
MAAICEYPAATNGTTPKAKIHEWQTGGLPRLNLRARNVQRGSRVVARVDLRASRHGWLPAFATCSWALAFLLAVGAWRLPYMLTLGSEIASIDPVGVVAAVLLFISGVIVRLLQTSGEHGLTRKLLFRLRQLAAITATLPILAVTALLFVTGGSALRWTWLGLAVAALIAAVLSTVSYILPKAPKPPACPP